VLTYVFEHNDKENNLSASFNEGFQALVEVCQEMPGTFDEKLSKKTQKRKKDHGTKLFLFEIGEFTQ